MTTTTTTSASVSTATTKKPTKREKFEMLMAIPEVQANPVLVEFVERELELLAKKNSSEKKPTATQAANEGIKDVILDGLTEPMTITDMQKKIDGLGELSNQKISALVRQMIMDGLVIKTEDKRKSYFSKA